MSHLSSGRINVAKFRDDARHAVTRILSNIPGSKTIAWEKSLIKSFNLVVEMSLLKSHDVSRMINFVEEDVNLPTPSLTPITTNIVIFILRGSLTSIEKMATAVKDIVSKEPFLAVKFYAIFIPRGSLICERVLSDHDLLGTFSPLAEYVIDLPIIFPFDYDLMSLEEEPATFKRYLLDRDTTVAFDMATALTRIQTFFGVIPNVKGVGRLSKKVYDLMKRLRSEEDGENLSSRRTSKIDSVVLFDRSVDMVTPLVTQQNYEGIIDELFGIRGAKSKFTEADFAPIDDERPGTTSPPTSTDSKELNLNSGEELFAQVRDLNFESAKRVFQVTSKKLGAVKEEISKASIPKLKEVTTNINQFIKTKKSVSNHVAIAEVIKGKVETFEFQARLSLESDLLNLDPNYDQELIEEMLFRSEDKLMVLRLLCLMSQTKGVKKSTLDILRKEFIQSYGFATFPTLVQLETVGLLKAIGSTMPIAIGIQTSYNQLKRSLNLTDPKFMEKFNAEAPPTIYHPYNGYAPISVKIIELLTRTGLASMSETMKSILGLSFDEVQSVDSRVTLTNKDRKVVLVAFIGGCTFAEVSCLRIVSRATNVDFLVLTSNMVNGNTFMSSFRT